MPSRVGCPTLCLTPPLLLACRWAGWLRGRRGWGTCSCGSRGTAGSPRCSRTGIPSSCQARHAETVGFGGFLVFILSQGPQEPGRHHPVRQANAEQLIHLEVVWSIYHPLFLKNRDPSITSGKGCRPKVLGFWEPKVLVLGTFMAPLSKEVGFHLLFSGSSLSLPTMRHSSCLAQHAKRSLSTEHAAAGALRTTRSHPPKVNPVAACCAVLQWAGGASRPCRCMPSRTTTGGTGVSLCWQSRGCGRGWIFGVGPGFEGWVAAVC